MQGGIYQPQTFTDPETYCWTGDENHMFSQANRQKRNLTKTHKKWPVQDGFYSLPESCTSYSIKQPRVLMASRFAAGPGSGAGARMGARDWARAGAGSRSGTGVLVLSCAAGLRCVLASSWAGRTGPGTGLPAFHLDPGVWGGGARTRAAVRGSTAVPSTVISSVPWPAGGDAENSIDLATTVLRGLTVILLIRQI